MVHCDVPFGMATSYHSTVFLYREGTQLYMSKMFNPHSEGRVSNFLLINTLAWMALAIGYYDSKDKENLNLPKIENFDWDEKIMEIVNGNTNNAPPLGIVDR